MAEHDLDRSVQDMIPDYDQRELEFQEYLDARRDWLNDWEAELAYDMRDPKHPRHHDTMADAA